ncbi:uncharacterized protein DEA37_0012358 [Paragonimus westermani]|uniref:Integrase catalytic domain-containing protein n=1 Tax=Paragonimus westermani TaxID=34504 RepID=A0A5J4N9J4_9TREM|nr:uncharacterized protein DEA37_0012358 [Paragonimus westermani]
MLLSPNKDGQHYTILFDEHNKCPEFIQLSHISSRATVINLRRVFSRFGVPEIMVLDRGAAWNSADFA